VIYDPGWQMLDAGCWMLDADIPSWN